MIKIKVKIKDDKYLGIEGVPKKREEAGATQQPAQV
jgi:hypothetical protein